MTTSTTTTATATLKRRSNNDGRHWIPPILRAVPSVVSVNKDCCRMRDGDGSVGMGVGTEAHHIRPDQNE